MEKFDLEKAKQGRQIVHKDGRKVSDWYAFMIGSQEINLMVQFENCYEVYGYTIRRDGSIYPDSTIGLAPERVEGHLTVHQGHIMTTKYGADYDIVVENPLEDLDVLFKVSCNPDGSDPTIERVE